jgi:hypothetical protein
MAERSWDELERPILEAVAELEDVDSSLGPPALANHTGLPVEQVRIGVRRLFETDLLTGSDDSDMGVAFAARALRLLPKGRQAVGQWPSSDPVEALLQVLAERIAVEDDPVERGRLEKARDSFAQMAKGVATASRDGSGGSPVAGARHARPTSPRPRQHRSPLRRRKRSATSHRPAAQ